MKLHIIGEHLKKDKLTTEEKKSLKKIVNNYFAENVGKWLYSDMEENIDMCYNEEDIN